MSLPTTTPQFSEYRRHLYFIGARQEAGGWTGHYCLMDVPEKGTEDASAAGQHHWAALDPLWATKTEAETNATEAAHAAIDALVRAQNTQ